MGCNCGKRGESARQLNALRTTTVYQVLINGSVDSEYQNLPEARKQAIAVGGRVKVTSKTG